MLLTWRPEDLDDRGDAFAAAVERVPDVTLGALGRLGPDDVARLAAAAEDAGMASYAVPALVEESEGLPLYVVEALAVGPARRVRRPAARRPRAAPGAPGRRVARPPASCWRRAP